MDLKTQNKQSLFYKFFSLLSVVRGYNVLLIIVAQYLVLRRARCCATVLALAGFDQLRQETRYEWIEMAGVCERGSSVASIDFRPDNPRNLVPPQHNARG